MPDLEDKMFPLLRNVLRQVEADSQSPGMSREHLRQQWGRFVREGGIEWLRELFPESERMHLPIGGGIERRRPAELSE